ncbi:MAG TPA: class I SAM-dependent methyltransferase [Acidimicrobiales bacterium]|nr:class I SAM-dependent methyltransferase [Acidimicrobiales bacterium]
MTTRDSLRAIDAAHSNANAEQARYWTEDGGPNWVRDEAVYDLMLTPFNDALIDALDPRPGERVLDVGCGFGSTALAAAARGAEVHGVDISPPLIGRARERAADVGANATFAVGDAQEDALDGPYDAVTSRFGVMFFADPIRAFRNFATATRPDGRLAFVCWQPLECNPWMLAAPNVIRSLMDDPPPPPPPGAGPFAFGDTAFVERVLTEAGWSETSIATFEADAFMGGHDGVKGAVNHVLGNSAAKALLAAGDASLRDRAAAILTEQFDALSVDGLVTFPAAAWLVTARR